MKSAQWTLLIGVALLMAFMVSGCDYQGYGQFADMVDGDGESADGDAPVDGDVPVTGSGGCDEPFIHGADGRALEMEGEGELSDASVVTGVACAVPVVEPTARWRLDGDAEDTESVEDSEVAESAETVEDADSDAELETDASDGDTDATVDGDQDDDGEIAPVLQSGAGPEVVVSIPMVVGDTLQVAFGGADFDALIYVLENGCDDTVTCSKFVNDKPTGEQEILAFSALSDGDYYIVMDSFAADASGDYSYTIQLTPAVGDGTPPEDGEAGAACVEADECATNFCLTTSLISSLLGGGTTIDVANGYCSAMSCAPCTEDIKGFCVNAGFVGEGYEVVDLCLRECEVTGDCRPADGQLCLDPQSWVDRGLMEQDVKDSFFGDHKACLPSGLVDAIEGELAL